MFKFNGIKDSLERTLGFSVRLLGIDFSVLLLGWINEWRLIDIRIPVNYGVYFQTLGLVLSIGRLPDDQIYQNNSN